MTAPRMALGHRRRSISSLRRRIGFVVWFVCLLLLSPPALADSAAPTTYRSQVTDLPVEGVAAEVVGGDSFLQIRVQPGTEVEVPGYEGEPYLRVGADGTVQVNTNSPSHWLNQDRFGQVGIPAGASAEATPDWETVAGGGSYGWHDHRIHWMSPDPPPSVDRSTNSLLYEWSVPIVVEGSRVSVEGILEWVPPVSPLPWLALAVATAGVLWWLGRIRGGVVGAAILASVVGLAQGLASPLGLWAEALTWMPPVIALLLAALPGPEVRRRMLSAVAAALLLVWAGLRLTTLWMPVLPSPLPAPLERAIVAATVGAAVGALIVLYRRSTRSPGAT